MAGTRQCCKGVFLWTHFEILHCFESQTEQAGLAQSRRAHDCRAGGRGFDSRGRTNTQGLKITEN